MTPQQAQQAREAVALSMMEEIARLGAWITSATPLRDKRLRFEVLNDQRESVLEKLATWDWHPRPCDQGTRIIPSGNAAVLRPTTVYELDLPRDETPTPAVRPITSRQISDDKEWRKMLEDFKGFKR